MSAPRVSWAERERLEAQARLTGGVARAEKKRKEREREAEARRLARLGSRAIVPRPVRQVAPRPIETPEQRAERERREAEAQALSLAQQERRRDAERREREKIDLPLFNGSKKSRRSVRVHPDELGGYETGGDHGLAGGFYLVRRSKNGVRSYFRVTTALYGSGKLYAQRLNPDRYTGKEKKLVRGVPTQYPVDECWDYSQALSHGDWMHLIARYGELMDAEAFKEFGQLYKVCIRCSKTLSNPMSVERGYGPDCAVHLGREHPLAPVIVEPGETENPD